MEYEQLHTVNERLDRIEAALTVLVERQRQKDWYSTAELAAILKKAEFTVREWCRLHRINAEKAQSGRGRTLEWRISAAELERLQKEGLLPLPKD
jgi:hypothetical protein